MVYVTSQSNVAVPDVVNVTRGNGVKIAPIVSFKSKEVIIMQILLDCANLDVNDARSLVGCEQ